MKKNHIRLLVGVMLVALLGLLGVQWYWVSNAVALKENQFRMDANEALVRVAERVQDHETSAFLTQTQYPGKNICHPGIGWLLNPENRDSGFHSRLLHSMQCQDKHGGNSQVELVVVTGHEGPQSGDVRGRGGLGCMSGRHGHRKHRHHCKSDPCGKRHASHRPAVPNAQDLDRGMFYLQTVMTRMMGASTPISERIQPELIDSLIRQELSQREITEQYAFQITEEVQASPFFVTSTNKSARSQDGNFRVRLFPHDLNPSEHYLELRFPERKSAALRAMGLLFPTSGILVLVVVLCFGIAVIAFQRQQKLSQLKTDFINNMTHELKTPISTISLALEAMGDPDMQTKARLSQYARIIQQENERLKTQVERVLQAAAFERGELKLDMQTVDMHELITKEIGRVQMQVEKRGGTISFQGMAESGLVSGDPLHLSGIIFNLLDNANKYSPDSPQITVASKSVAGGIEVSVIDEGTGIGREEQKRIFEKFYRVPTGNVHDVKGFGLGLSYVASMTAAHGGRIQVSSEPGKGSVFTVFLPQKNPHHAKT